MEQLMQEIHAINGLKKNQNLSYEEKQKLIKGCIRIYVADRAANAYKQGVKDSKAAIENLLNLKRK